MQVQKLTSVHTNVQSLSYSLLEGNDKMIASSDTGVVRVWELPHRGYIKAVDEFNMFDDPHGTKG